MGRASFDTQLQSCGRKSSGNQYYVHLRDVHTHLSNPLIVSYSCFDLKYAYWPVLVHPEDHTYLHSGPQPSVIERPQSEGGSAGQIMPRKVV